MDGTRRGRGTPDRKDVVIITVFVRWAVGGRVLVVFLSFLSFTFTLQAVLWYM